METCECEYPIPVWERVWKCLCMKCETVVYPTLAEVRAGTWECPNCEED